MPDTLRSERKGRRASAAAVAAIAVIAAIAALAGPAAAQDILVSNLSTSASGREGLADSEYIQSFTTGPNVSGYLLESISIDFFKGSVGARDPVYVYLYEDNGSGRPRSRAIATLTKNGINFAPPVTGVNKYKIWKARCYPQPPHGGGCLQDPSSVHLAPNTTYWVYVWAGSSTTGAELQSDTATAETGAAGWTLGNTAFSKPSGGSSDGVYTYTSISAPLRIKVEGKINPAVNVSVNDVTVTEGVELTADFVVSLSRKASGPVQVSYGTFDLFGSSPADEGSDYEATSGTLTFRPGQTRKTVSVPILDDARNEGDETFGLALTNLQGATFAANSGTGTIVNADPLTVSISDATATEGVDATIDFTVSLNRATNRRLTVNVLFSSGTADFSDITEPDQTSVTFEPGQTQKTYSIGIVNDTENEPSETFSVILQVPGPPNRVIVGAPGSGTILNTETLEASFKNIPQDHDGSTAFTFQVHFTNDVSITPAAMRDHAFTVTNGDVTGASRVDGRDDRWLITVDPDGDDAVTITLPGNRTCGTQGAICSKEDNPVQLTNSPSVTVAAPPEGDPLTASFSNVPDSHDGGDFHVDLTFSEGPDVGYSDVQKAVKVSGGSINRANRKTRGSSVGWKLKVRPAGTGALTITLPATLNCSSSGAICTEDGRRLSHSLSTVVAGAVSTPAVSVSDASAAEGDAVAFTVSLSEASSQQVTVEYATSDGTAAAGSDYTAASGTLTFAAGETTKTVSVATTDDSGDEDDETLTLTLSSPVNATLGDATATGTINDNDNAAPLTAGFSDMPATHTGDEFTFGLAFSENVELRYVTLRDTAFVVTGGEVKTAQRQQQGSNQAWNITVEPDGQGAVTITLPETTDCGASGAICTGDGRPLSHSLSSVVAGPVIIPAVSVSDASAAEGDAVAFTVSLSVASSQQVTVEYATSGGTATSGTDFSAESGTLTFAANETSKTVSVATTDDSAEEDNETFTLTLSSPTNATLGDATATGTINDDDVSTTPLTASFSNMPASHTGEEFTFGLTFSENVELSYVTLRDTAFVVTGGEVKTAQRQQQGSNQAWNITVEPASANDTVTIMLPETTDCGAVDAICTGDERPLSHSLSATVVDSASSSAGDAVGGDVVVDEGLDDALALVDGVTPEEAAAALFGERGLSEARRAALDRLGNRNGRYDLGDMLSWRDRCLRGEARCGRSSTDSGPASAAALLGVAAAGRRRTSKQPKRGDSGHRGSLPVRGMRRRARKAGYALAMLLAATMAWSCTDGSVGPAAPAAAVRDPGFLTVEWTGPAAALDIGVLLELEGPGIETVRAPGLDLYQSSAPGRHQVVVAGSLRAGPLMQFKVPDRGQLPLYRVRVVQVTGEDYALRDPGEYRAVIQLTEAFGWDAPPDMRAAARVRRGVRGDANRAAARPRPIPSVRAW